MGSFKFGFKIEKGEAAKIRIKIDISGISGTARPEPERDLQPAHAGPATGTTLPLPFPQAPEETEPMEKVSIPKGPPGFWQRIFSRFRNR